MVCSYINNKNMCRNNGVIFLDLLFDKIDYLRDDLFSHQNNNPLFIMVSEILPNNMEESVLY